jgi:phosphoglycolate phosphatase-like HAD superfamily hydrolase
MQAASAAHVPIKIGITHGFESAELLQRAGADHIIDSLGELLDLLKQLTR